MSFSKLKTIKRKGAMLTDYGQPEYLDGATAQFFVAANDHSWVAYFTDEQDAKDYLAIKTGTKVT